MNIKGSPIPALQKLENFIYYNTQALACIMGGVLTTGYACMPLFPV